MRKTIFLVVLVVILALTGYLYWSYYFVYDEGSKEGILYSFSRKGNVFKTYEGVILQPGLRSASTGGLTNNEFHFSVTDDAMADSLTKIIGMQMNLHYNLYHKSLPWRGDNYNNDNKGNGQYIVDKIVVVKKPDNTYNNL